MEFLAWNKNPLVFLEAPLRGFHHCFLRCLSGVFFTTYFYHCFWAFSFLIAFIHVTNFAAFCQILRFPVVIPRVLRIWESFFYSHAFFTLHSFPQLPLHRKCYRFERLFLISGVFYLTLLPNILHNLFLSKLPWEPIVLPWRLHGLPLGFETQT